MQVSNRSLLWEPLEESAGSIFIASKASPSSAYWYKNVLDSSTFLKPADIVNVSITSIQLIPILKEMCYKRGFCLLVGEEFHGFKTRISQGEVYMEGNL